MRRIISPRELTQRRGGEMNGTRIKGIGLITLGTIEHTAGMLLRSRRMQSAGFAHRIAGASKLAIARATVRIGARLQAAKQVRAASSNER